MKKMRATAVAAAVKTVTANAKTAGRASDLTAVADDVATAGAQAQAGAARVVNRAPTCLHDNA